ncbi:PAS domain S-box protein [Salinigranum salinum]|uniref:PAS domain S-box protein n=1 Tax=Salinigranum salinum TaxID=1364937 RepID=UPI00126071CC|nr:PAS domain S-box protein [Salinigranum salinum]
MDSAGSLSDRLSETLSVFEERSSEFEPLTTSEVADTLSCSRRATYNRLDELVARDALSTKKVGARGRIWWLPLDQAPDATTRAGSGSGTATADVIDRGGGGPQLEFQSLVGAVEEYAIFMLDADGHVVTWNEGAKRIKGYEREAIVGDHYSTFYTEEAVADGTPGRNLDRAAAEGSIELTGWRRRADGSRFWATATLTAIRDDDGELQGYTKVTRDMTDRREYERKLRRQRDVVRTVLETSTAGIALLDADGTVVRSNGPAVELLGPSAATDGDATEWPVVDAEGASVAPDEHPLGQIVDAGEVATDREVRIRGSDGDVRWVSINTAPLTDTGGNLDRIVVTAHDITTLQTRKQRLARQRDALRRELDEVFDRIDDGVFALDREWRFTYANERAEVVLGRPIDELVGEPVWAAFSDADSRFREVCTRAMETQKPVEFETTLSTPDARFEVRVHPSESGLSIHLRDVTERWERERQLERYETIVETVDDGIYAVDADARFVLVNDAFCEMTGYGRDDLLGTSATLVHDDEITPRAVRLVEEIAAGERETANIELDIHRADGTSFPAESRLGPVQLADGRGRCGVVRDVTARVERERELERRVRQQRVVTRLGQRALESHDLDALMREASERVAETLDTDYCKVLDLDRDADRLVLRQGVGWHDGIVGSATVSAVDDESQAAHTLASRRPIVVEDLEAESRFSGPDLLTDHDVHSGISTIVGSFERPWGILGTHDRDRKAFSEQDVNFVQSVATILATAIDRQQNEHRLRNQRERLTALNNLYEVVSDITDAVVSQSTREEIERVVCERLADSDSYQFTWIGEVDSRSQTVQLRREAGVEGYLDDITISVDPDDPRSRGATGRAVETMEMRVSRNLLEDPDYEPWYDHLRNYGFRSLAAIPITHDGTLYGTLAVYADRSNAFEEQERAVIRQLGEVMGHAIASIERKRALMSDEVVSVEYLVRDVFDEYAVPAIDGRVTLERVTPIGDGEHLAYGTISAAGFEQLRTRVGDVPSWREVTAISEESDTVRFELRLSEAPVVSAVASRGGYVRRAVVEDGDYRIEVHLPPGVETRQISDVVRETFPEAKFVSQRHSTRPLGSGRSLLRVLSEDLTERQRTVLEAAYFSGYFGWPRESTGEAVADSLGVSPPTFHQHLRIGVRKLLDSTFADVRAVNE